MKRQEKGTVTGKGNGDQSRAVGMRLYVVINLRIVGFRGAKRTLCASQSELHYARSGLPSPHLNALNASVQALGALVQRPAPQLQTDQTIQPSRRHDTRRPQAHLCTYLRAVGCAGACALPRRVLLARLAAFSPRTKRRARTHRASDQRSGWPKGVAAGKERELSASLALTLQFAPGRPSRHGTRLDPSSSPSHTRSALPVHVTKTKLWVTLSLRLPPSPTRRAT